MERKKKYLFLLLAFAIACGAAYLFENPYHGLVREFYIRFSRNKVTFLGSDLEFTPSYWFVGAFGLFASAILFCAFKLNLIQNLINILFSALLFFVSTGLLCAINGSIQAIDCSNCYAGKSVLNFNDIGYTSILMLSMLAAFLSFLLIEKLFTKKMRLQKVSSSTYNDPN